MTDDECIEDIVNVINRVNKLYYHVPGDRDDDWVVKEKHINGGARQSRLFNLALHSSWDKHQEILLSIRLETFEFLKRDLMEHFNLINSYEHPSIANLAKLVIMGRENILIKDIIE